MKAAIITLPLHTNYGGIIQAWALQQILKSYNIESEVLNHAFFGKITAFQKVYKYPYRAFLKFILRKDFPIREEEVSKKLFYEKIKNIYPFIKKNINIRTFHNIKEIKKKDYDLIIIGSDQIWRPSYSKFFDNKIKHSFGWFARKWNIPIISYAPSFGIDDLSEFTEKNKLEISSLLKIYSGISVREKTGVNLCAQLGVNALHVLDPTLLITKEAYESLIPRNIPKRRGIMTYILDANEDASYIAANFSESKGLPVFSALPVMGETVPPIEYWLAGFRDADFIITDSFHACVFSIIFQKPFLVVENKNRGCSRIHSLLQTFDLENHLVSGESHLSDFNNYIISDSKINYILESERKKSFLFLEKFI